MSEPRFSRRLQLTQREYREILARLETRYGAVGAVNGRTQPRHEYHVVDLPLSVEQPEGGLSSFLVYGRNLSRGGMSILHSGFLHIGSRCRIVLRKLDRSPMVLHGEIAHCRLAIPPCHEIGIRFLEEIDPRQVIGTSAACEDDPEPKEPRLVLSGSALLAEPFSHDRRLLEHQLAGMDLSVRPVSTPGATLDALQLDFYDVVLFGLDLRGEDGARTIAKIRELGCPSPVIVLANALTPEVLTHAEAYGAAEILPKPCPLERLGLALESHLAPRPARRTLFSTLAADHDTSELVTRYVDWVHRTGEVIARDVTEGQWDEVVGQCERLRGTGLGYGFRDLTLLATSALSAVQRDRTSNETRVTLNGLIECCRLVATRRAGHAA